MIPKKIHKYLVKLLGYKLGMYNLIEKILYKYLFFRGLLKCLLVLNTPFETVSRLFFITNKNDILRFITKIHCLVFQR